VVNIFSRNAFLEGYVILKLAQTQTATVVPAWHVNLTVKLSPWEVNVFHAHGNKLHSNRYLLVIFFAFVMGRLSKNTTKAKKKAAKVASIAKLKKSDEKLSNGSDVGLDTDLSLLDEPFEVEDFRGFNKEAYLRMKRTGLWDMLLRKLTLAPKKLNNHNLELLFFPSSCLPLSDIAHNTLIKYILCFESLMIMLATAYEGATANSHVSIGPMIAKICEVVKGISARSLTANFKIFINNEGCLSSATFIRKGHPSKRSLINDAAARATMSTWMTAATRQQPPAGSKDFVRFVKVHYGTTISQRTAVAWLLKLGFTYKPDNKLEIYQDGHQRPDVQEALQRYIQQHGSLMEQINMYHGSELEFVIPPQSPASARAVESSSGQTASPPVILKTMIGYHDEASVHTNELSKSYRWGKKGRGNIKNKSEGQSAMVVAFVTNEFGIMTAEVFEQAKVGYFNGLGVQKHALKHLEECLRVCPEYNNIISVFDNSTGHNCVAEDALKVYKMNKGIGKDRSPTYCYIIVLIALLICPKVTRARLM
jgi:hypothetical protein